jgi:undecaprenyl-diphosphatase
VRAVDSSLLHAVNGFLFHHDAVEDPLLFYVNASEALFVATLVVVFIAARGSRPADWRRVAVAAVASAGLGLLAAKVISELVDRARPFVAEPHQVHLFTAHAADSGFPSDHATAAFAIAVAIFLRTRAWGWVALGFATVLAVGRVGLGVHYPSDVLAGAALGAAAAGVLWAPPLRQRLDRLADRAGGYWDRAVERGTESLSTLRR